MKLRIKALIILASIWAIVSLIVFSYSKTTLTNEYLRIEKNEIADDLIRTSKTLDSLFSALKLLTADWGQWNDVFQFMGDKNEAFITTNLNMPTLENTKLHMILLFDTDGKLHHGVNYDLEKNKFLTLPTELINTLESQASYTKLTRASQTTTGLIKLENGYAVIAAHPIFSSEGKGPSRGTLIMGYFLTDQHLAKLSEILKIQVHLYPLPIPKNDTKLQSIFNHLNATHSLFVSPKNKDIIEGYTFIKNISGTPIGMLKIEEPRVLYKEGLRTIHWYLTIVTGLGILFLGMIWFLLKIFVLDRILKVNQQLIEINHKEQFDTAIDLSGNDELNNMVSNVNSLLEIIQLSEKQLKYRISLSAEQLERLSKLNKNLHHEMIQQRLVEEELREGEKALKYMAYYDMLTGLPNRLFFHELIEKQLIKAGHEGSGVAILFLDADRFKSINDTYGHAVGDLFLKHTADQLKSSIGPNDLAARISGDEFIICLTNISGKALIGQVADKILENASKPLELDGSSIHSTFSMGISLYPDDALNIEELENYADLAMYFAKKNQLKTSYCFYDDVINKVTISS